MTSRCSVKVRVGEQEFQIRMGSCWQRSKSGHGNQPGQVGVRTAAIWNNLSLIRAPRAANTILLILTLGLSLAAQSRSATACPPKSPSQAHHITQPPEPSLADPFATKGHIESRPLIIVEAPIKTPGTLSRRYPMGSGFLRFLSSASVGQPLTSDFFAAADPRVSFDGSRLLFSGKKTADSFWQIYEMNVDGTGLVQLTRCSGDCVQPAYIAHAQIVFTSLSKAPSGPSPSQPQARGNAARANAASPAGETSQIWVSKLDGSDAHPITFGPGDFQVETVLKNGTILVTARTPLLPSNGRPADRELYTIRLDGTALSTLRCDHGHPAIRSQATELDDGSIVFIQQSLASSSVAGQLEWIRRGAIHNEPLAAATVLAMSPQPIVGTELVVARESLANAQSGTKAAISSFNADGKAFGPPLFQDHKLAAVEAVPIAAHETPRWYWSTLNPDWKRGFFICLNAYLAQDAPGGKIPTTLARVRVLTLDSATQHESLLGDATVEEDGSFYIAVPSDQPVRFELLDAAGKVVREQKSWIWARPGEEHGCVGCHEERAVAPENRWPMALRRFDTPTRLDLVRK